MDFKRKKIVVVLGTGDDAAKISFTSLRYDHAAEIANGLKELFKIKHDHESSGVVADQDMLKITEYNLMYEKYLFAAACSVENLFCDGVPVTIEDVRAGRIDPELKDIIKAAYEVAKALPAEAEEKNLDKK